MRNHDLLFFREPLTRAHGDALEGCEALSVFIYSRVQEEVLAELPSLTFVQTHSTGYDHIDLAACVKRGVVIANTARGDLIDTAALVAALESGIVGAAALDVIEGEQGREQLSMEKTPVHEAHASLLAHPRVIVTPHMGFYSREALERILHTTIQTLVAFSQNQPVNVVSVN